MSRGGEEDREYLRVVGSGWTTQINNTSMPSNYIPSNLKSTTLIRSDSDSSSNYYSADGNSTYEFDLGTTPLTIGLGTSSSNRSIDGNSMRNSYHTTNSSPKTTTAISNNNSTSHIPSVLPSPAFFHPRRSPSVSPRREKGDNIYKEKGPKVTRIISEFEIPFTTSGKEDIRMRRENSQNALYASTSSAIMPVPGPSYSSNNQQSNPNSGGSNNRDTLLAFPTPTASTSNYNRSISNSGEEVGIIAGMRSTLQKARNSFHSSTRPTSIEGGDFGRKSDDGSIKRLSRKGGVLLPDVDVPPLPPPHTQSLSVQQFKNLRPLSSMPNPRPRTILLDENGNPIRNHQLHSGSNRFCLDGRLLSSKDNPLPFIASLAIAIIIPILFFAFSGSFLWTHLNGGGKASLFLFAWLTAIMLTNMVSFFFFRRFLTPPC